MIQFKLRMPDSLHASLKEASDISENSLNSELIKRLDESVKSDSRSWPISAKQANELTLHSAKAIYSKLKSVVFYEVRAAAQTGKLSAYIDLSRFEIGEGDVLFIEAILDPLMKDLRQQGYQILDNWDLGGFFIRW